MLHMQRGIIPNPLPPDQYAVYESVAYDISFFKTTKANTRKFNGGLKYFTSHYNPTLKKYLEKIQGYHEYALDAEYKLFLDPCSIQLNNGNWTRDYTIHIGTNISGLEIMGLDPNDCGALGETPEIYFYSGDDKRPFPGYLKQLIFDAVLHFDNTLPPLP